MISCTEFIPLYSEFFNFLEAQGGHDAVLRYWEHIADNSIGDKSNPNSLASYLERSEDKIAGAWAYWNRSLSEEASDVLRIYDPEKKYFCSHMRHCPSRGMLNELKHIDPYYDYCEHCNVIYKKTLAEHGIVGERDNSKVEHAECASLYYLKGHRPEGDYRAIDEHKIVLDIHKEDNKYLHRDFHLSADLALQYCGEQFGNQVVCDFLTTYVHNFYSPQIQQIRAEGLPALEQWLQHIYEIEEARDVLHTKLTEHSLLVTIDYSPVIAYMHSLHQEPSQYYIEQTRTLYAAIASACDLDFTLDYYEANGHTQFRFQQKTGAAHW